MRLNRGLLIIALVAIPVTLANVFLTGIFYALFLCFDTCPPIGSIVSYPSLQGYLALLTPSLFLLPALGLLLAAWIWMLVELGRLGARRARAFAIAFPLITLVAIVLGVIIASLLDNSALVVSPFDLWYGSFALTLWPALIALVAWRWRAPTPTAAAPG